MLAFLDRLRLALGFGILIVSLIGTTKIFSSELYRTLHDWQSTALVIGIPLAFLIFSKMRIQ
jgi:hypothetical protein